MYLSKLRDTIAFELGKTSDINLKLILENLIISTNAKLLKEEYAKRGGFPQSALIPFCVNMKSVYSTSCCGIDLGCKLPVTTVNIPSPLSVKDYLNFTSVTDILGVESFTYIKPYEVKYIRDRKFSNRDTFYTYVDKKIIIFNKPAIEKIKVFFVPSNPLELLELVTCEDKPCLNSIDDYSIEDSYEDAITKLIFTKLGYIKKEEIMINKEN